jgi:ribosomal protein S12 methylthiotransferase accessory factor YcaO
LEASTARLVPPSSSNSVLGWPRRAACTWLSPTTISRRVWSLTRQEFRYLPTAYCYYGPAGQRQDEFCRADSNGSAAGNSLEEAILQGFLELVERDCVAL